MEIGRLDKKVQILKEDLTDNGLGELDRLEPVLSKPLFCKIIPLSATKIGQQASLESVANKYRITFRKNSVKDLKEEDIIVYNGERYEIETIEIDLLNDAYKDVVVKRTRGD